VITKPLTCIVAVALTALALAGCAGEIDDDDALEVDETESALTASPNAGESDDGDEGGDCNDRDNGGHKHHHKHKFKVLDRLDGAKDHVIVIGALPAGLPARLIAKLQKIDADGDGAVSKDELKAHRKAHKHHGDKRDGDKGKKRGH